MIDLVSGCSDKLFPQKNVGCMGKGISKCHDNKI